MSAAVLWSLFIPILWEIAVGLTLDVNSRNLTFNGRIHQHFDYKLGPLSRRSSPNSCLSCEFHDKTHLRLVRSFPRVFPQDFRPICYYRGALIGATDQQFQAYSIQRTQTNNFTVNMVSSSPINNSNFMSSNARHVVNLPWSKEIFLVFENNRVMAFRKSQAGSAVSVSLIHDSPLKLNTTRIRKIVAMKDVVAILSGKFEVIFGHVGANGEFKILKKMNHSSIKWEHKQTTKRDFRILDFLITEMPPVTKSGKAIRPVKHCFKKTEFEELRCVDLTNLAIEVTLIEPSHSKDRMILRTTLKQVMSRDKFPRTKLKLAINYGVYRSLSVWGKPAFFIRRKEGCSVKFGAKKFHFGKQKPELIYSGELANFHLISIRSGAQVILLQFFRTSTNTDPESIIVKKHVIESVVGLTSDISHVSLIPYMDRTELQFVLIFGPNLLWYRVEFGHYRAVCKSVQKWFFMSCVQRFRLSFVDWKQYVQAGSFETTSQAVDSTELVLNYKFANFNWESLLVIPLFAIMGMFMFFLMKPNAERRARARVERIRKLR